VPARDAREQGEWSEARRLEPVEKDLLGRQLDAEAETDAAARHVLALALERLSDLMPVTHRKDPDGLRVRPALLDALLGTGLEKRTQALEQSWCDRFEG